MTYMATSADIHKNPLFAFILMLIMYFGTTQGGQLPHDEGKILDFILFFLLLTFDYVFGKCYLYSLILLFCMFNSCF